MSDGTLEFAFDFQLESIGSNVNIHLRERSGSSKSYTNIVITGSGGVNISDAGGSRGNGLAVLTLDQTYRFRIAHDLDAGTYSVFLDDTPLVQNAAHGMDVTEVGRGLGALLLGYSANGDVTWNTAHFDNVTATRTCL